MYVRYVELLEQQQLQLTDALQKFYQRALDNDPWPGQPLEITSTGQPLIHDILQRLGAIQIQGANAPEHFEEDFGVMQQRLVASGAGPINRQSSVESGSSESIPTTPEVFSPFEPNLQMPFFQPPPPPPPPPPPGPPGPPGHMHPLYSHSPSPPPPPPRGNMMPLYSNPPSLSFPYSQGPLFVNNFGYDQTPRNGPMSSPTDYAHANPCLPMFNCVDEEGRGGGFPLIDMARQFGVPQDQRP
ncbi:MAG: hypothetical protein LQ350_001257 [Teloschistes chrysophthalmus]|nr:MAG: hypothetical protein LQ350_001257 [Niorma chrysophthalma]